MSTRVIRDVVPSPSPKVIAEAMRSLPTLGDLYTVAWRTGFSMPGSNRTNEMPRKPLSFRGILAGLAYLCSSNSTTPVTVARLREILTSDSNEVRSLEPATRRPWTRLSDEARADVANRYVAGETSTVLAKEYGVAKSTILGILRAGSVVVRRQALTTEQVSEAARLYESGLSLSRTAEQLNVNQETMRIAIIAAGVDLRPPTGEPAKKGRGRPRRVREIS